MYSKRGLEINKILIVYEESLIKTWIELHVPK